MRSALALIASAVLAIALAMVCAGVPKQTVDGPEAQRYAAHWVTVQFIDSGVPGVNAEEEWSRAAELVSGHLAHSENGMSLRRVLFLMPRDYDALLQTCDDLKMMDCVFDALPDPVIETSDGDEMFQFEHTQKMLSNSQ